MVADVFGLHVKEPREAQIDAGAEALRQRLQSGKVLRPWSKLPNSGSMPYERLEVLRQSNFMELRFSEDPGFVKHVKSHLTHQLAERMLEDGYIHFEEVQHNPTSNVIRATIGVVPKEKVLPVAKQMEQLEAKLTCMCGDYADHHSMSNGHAPVSQYDYSLQRMEEENERLKGEIARLERRIKQVFP